MSDNEEAEVKPFEIERAKQGRAKCKKCNSQCEVNIIKNCEIRVLFIQVLNSRLESYDWLKSIPTIHSVRVLCDSGITSTVSSR